MTTTVEATELSTDRRGSLPMAALRITLGVILVATWIDNVTKDLYTADGYAGLINWLFAEDGNNSSLGFYQSFLESVVVPNAGLVGAVQLVVELVIGVGLLVGLFTRAFSLAAAGFFLTLFLGYFGGNEWIWTYVLLLVSALVVFFGHGGRQLGVDRWLATTRGEIARGLIW